MRVIWDTEARAARNQVADYIGSRFGVKRKITFLQAVRETTKLLCDTPQIGSIDPLFADRPLTYRSVVIKGLSKMVYRIDGDIIYIAAFWDTRREPKNQIRKIKS